MYNLFYSFKTTISKIFLKTPYQHAFSSTICLHLTVSAGAAYIRTDKLYDSCKVNRAISSNPLLCDNTVIGCIKTTLNRINVKLDIAAAN